jgi:hypothetical protein
MSKFRIPLFLIALAALGSYAVPGRDHDEHIVVTPDHSQHAVNHEDNAHDHGADATHDQAGHVPHLQVGDHRHGQSADHTSHADHSTLGNHLEANEDLDHIALAEMQTAALQYGEVHELPDTFGTADTWSHEWSLRWNDYEIGANTIRIYHATNRHNHNLRYTFLWDVAHGHYVDWHRTH